MDEPELTDWLEILDLADEVFPIPDIPGQGRHLLTLNDDGDPLLMVWYKGVHCALREIENAKDPKCALENARKFLDKTVSKQAPPQTAEVPQEDFPFPEEPMTEFVMLATMEGFKLARYAVIAGSTLFALYMLTGCHPVHA